MTNKKGKVKILSNSPMLLKETKGLIITKTRPCTADLIDSFSLYLIVLLPGNVLMQTF